MSTPEQRPSQFPVAPDAASRQTDDAVRNPGQGSAAVPPTAPPPGATQQVTGSSAFAGRRSGQAEPASPSSSAVSIRRNLAPRESASDSRGPSTATRSNDAPASAGRPAVAEQPAETSAHPPNLDERSSAIPVPADHGDTRFREAGRGDYLARPNAPHLDDRLTGLDKPTPAGRRFLGRRRSAPGFENRPSDGLRRQIHSPRRISVVGMKGGVGKTTLSILTSTAITRATGLPVLLLDSDTTYGSLMLRTGLAPRASAEDLARMGDPGDLRVLSSAVSQTSHGVWVVPSGRTPAQSAAFGEASYVAAVRAVYRHFPVMLTDCGAGLAGPLMHRVISASHSLVIATAPSMDSLLASYNTLEWLASIGYQDLAKRSIIAISNVEEMNPRIDLAETRRRFSALAGDVVVIPADPHLAPGSVLDYDELSEQTRAAAEILAGSSLSAALSAP